MNRTKKLALTLVTATMATSMFLKPVIAAKGIVTTESLRVRKEPNTSSDILTILDEDDTVDVIEKDGDWYKINLPNEDSAYVYSQYIKLEENLTTDNNTSTPKPTETPSNVEENETTPTAVVETPVVETNNNVDFASATEVRLEENTVIYILPLFFSSEIGKVEDNSRMVKLIEKINNWLCVEYDGIMGWVFDDGKIVATTTTDETSDEPVTPIEIRKGYVNVTSAYVRESNSKSSSILMTLSLNDEVDIIGENDNWYEIKLGDDRTGYIYVPLVSDEQISTTSRGAVNRAPLEEEHYEEVQDTSVVDVNSLPNNGYQQKSGISIVKGNDVPKENNSESNVETKKEEQQVVNVEQIDNQQNEEKNEIDTEVIDIQEHYVEYSETNNDVQEEYSEPEVEYYEENSEEYYEEPVEEYYEEEYTIGQQIADVARGLVGRPYVYGAAGPYSFDCSGLTLYVYEQFGVYLPHGASWQNDYGDYIGDYNDLQPGDLLIYRDYNNSSIGHCGIYIGDDCFVHAANPRRGVVVTSIYDGYYTKRFVAGRRLLY